MIIRESVLQETLQETLSSAKLSLKRIVHPHCRSTLNVGGTCVDELLGVLGHRPDHSLIGQLPDGGPGKTAVYLQPTVVISQH